MGRKVLLAAAGVGAAFAALATFMDFESSPDIPRNSRGMIVGTMAHLRGVKLTAAICPKGRWIGTTIAASDIARVQKSARSSASMWGLR